MPIVKNDYSQARWDEGVRTRFWSKVSKGPEGACWDWLGGRSPRGYAIFSIDNVAYAAHRLAYCHLVAPVPADLVCDHLCRNRSCVNPSHLEPVANRENVSRGLAPIVCNLRNGSITHCPQGHAYTPENTRIGTKGSRTCRTCEKAGSARLTAKRRDARARALAGAMP